MSPQHHQQQMQFSQSVARRMTDLVHSDVKSMVAHSRLTRKSDNIALVTKSQLQITGLLGQGAFSEVHQVTNTHDGKTYALKHLKLKLVNQPDNFRLAAAELAVEAHMLASFDHPNIIGIRGWAANGVSSYSQGRHDSFFLLLDKLHETLDQRIETWQRQESAWQAQAVQTRNSLSGFFKRFSNHHNDHHRQQQQQQQQAAQQQHQALQCRQQHQEQVHAEKLGVLTEIAAALAYLHEKGVIFRDLKPNNIGFCQAGRVKLFDFGLSRELPTLDVRQPFQMSGKVGTLRYMATEVASHLPYNVSADVYSWAMVAYEVLSLQKPFAGWTRDMHTNLVCGQGQRPALDGIPADLQRLLTAAWCQQADQRPCTNTVLYKMGMLEKEQLMVLQQRQQDHHFTTQQPVVELPANFSIALRKAPGRTPSDFTGGTMSLETSLAGY